MDSSKDIFNRPYDPKGVEDKIYKFWEESGYFNPDKLPLSKVKSQKSKVFTIVIPPPNITGSLHLGHALNAVIQDILMRKKRMEGYRTLWLPGIDHAGIATQNVVEKELKKQGISRHQLGREKFLERVLEWKEKYGHIILDQLKKLGASLDWSRLRFTMDEDYQEAVKTAFIHYYNRGWIYRGERTVNWCSRCGTSLSDLEIEYKEEEATMYYIKYGPLVIATVRPETKLGDTAVAVNPKDSRYKKYIGKEIEIDTVLGPAKMKVIADEHVDMKFGTGVMKVTPAHDLHDFELAQKHNLEKKQVIGPDGRMTQLAGKYAGMKIEEARKTVVEDMKSKGLLLKTELYTHNVAKCYRCGTVLEPILSKQWFLKMNDLAKKAIKAVKSGKVKFHPKRWEKIYFDWLENIKDWCISRQIWWGHRIPAWICVGCGEVVLDPKIKANWFIVRHGETDWNKEGRVMGQEEIPLNQEGLKQVRESAKVLRNKNIDLIISSDLKRCKETAEIIVKETGAEVIFDKDLRELHMGELQGKLNAEWPKEYEDNYLESMGGPPGGERFEEFEKRVWKAFNRHRVNHRHKNIAIVTHGGPIRVIFRKVKGLSYKEAITLDLNIANASINELVIGAPCKKCGVDLYQEVLDVLDTWFSSALWPFAALGWKGQPRASLAPKGRATKIDLEKFYPTQVLSTDRGIINLWVARMIFSGLEFMGKEPFKDVIIHATILTKEGERMSKSKGTGVDPLDLIEKYGADATRFGLIWQTMGTQDVRWSEEHVIAGKKFANKIWNAARFAILNSQAPEDYPSELTPNYLINDHDKKIYKAMEKSKNMVSSYIDKFEFGQALHVLYNFFWHEFCDVYIEKSKEQLNNKVLGYVLLTSLKLLHPFMPFVTEAIYQKVPRGGTESKSLMIQ